MKTVFLLYITDKWHTQASKNLLGIFSNGKKLFEYLKRYEGITENDLEQLKEMNQTQGKQTNFIILEETINPK